MEEFFYLIKVIFQLQIVVISKKKFGLGEKIWYYSPLARIPYIFLSKFVCNKNSMSWWGKNIDTGGKEYHIFSPSWKLQLALTSQDRKKCWPGKKICFSFPSCAIFWPFVKLDKYGMAWGGKNMDTGGKNIIHFPPVEILHSN